MPRFGFRRRRRRMFRPRRMMGRRGSYKSKFISHNRMSGRPGPHPELKYQDYYDNTVFQPAQINGANFSASGISPIGMAVLNVIMEGAAAWNRIGRRINMKSIEVSAVVRYSANPAAASTGEIIRLALVYDKQYNGSFFTNSSVLWQSDRQTSGGTGSTVSVLSPVNLANRDRFLILKEWRYGQIDTAITTPATAAATMATALQARLPGRIHWYVKLKGLETVFQSTTGTADGADVTSGALLLVFVSNQTTANSCFRINFASRLRFYD